MSKPDSVLVFGAGLLQLSMIRRIQEQGLKAIAIDPNPEAPGKETADLFKVVGGQDFEATLEVCRRHEVSGIVTAATDKPLEMMARVAEASGLPFYSVETAQRSTDKWLMKNAFQDADLPHAAGQLLQSDADLQMGYPVVIKPRDSSGSRGVSVVHEKSALATSIQEAMASSRMDSVVAEELVHGQEYSLECIHLKGKTTLLQVTEKMVTPMPYRVELGHLAPAEFCGMSFEDLEALCDSVGEAMGFDHCVSHIEIMIREGKGAVIIEASPRLGGDFITSHLVPLASGRNMEVELVQISLGKESGAVQLDSFPHAGIFYLHFEEGRVVIAEDLTFLDQDSRVQYWSCELKKGDTVPRISNSLTRYGQLIITAQSRHQLLQFRDDIFAQIETKLFGHAD